MSYHKVFESFTILIVLFASILAVTEIVNSGVYKWPDLNNNLKEKIILNGATTDLANLKIYAQILEPKESRNQEDNYAEYETMIIFKKGQSKIQFNDTEKILSPGSIAIIYPNEKYKIENVGDNNVEYYLFEYKSKAPVDYKRGLSAGGSFIVDWDTLKFVAHDKGGVRQYCERATAMFEYFSMHVTTLNPGIKSHEPHLHKSDEMIVMISGNTNMEIGEENYSAEEGDVYFLGAEIPHAISNTGNESCMYYAFHFE
ncbi:MAG: cupin domain-containing protein [Ignavibacteriae bacterium]|nr:cupin domain-containing protein [Ignavibacteriota bacterium]